ncbi:MAG TPA: hypothetical protein VHO29_19505 [Marmoricola sp.]|nr:hypothetical protein [Marmoricola sp.]
MEINGLPLHPLIIHAVVVLVPLGALSAIGFAVVPRWRWLLRWPTLVLAVAAVVLTRIAVVSGTRLKADRQLGGDLVHRHQVWGHRLEYAVWVFAVVAIVAWWVLPVVMPLVGRVDRPSPLPSAVAVVAVLLPVTAAVVLVFAVITGDAGAQALWKIQRPQ